MSNPLNTRSRKQKLELTWIGKYDKQKPIEPRILIEVPEFSYHAPKRYSVNDIFDNRLIFGDNLLALKAIEQEFLGKIKCVYIDPPFNTGNAFDNYEDGLEHSVWLNLMGERIRVLHRLLREDGALFVHLDDNEVDYCKVLIDEVFGRQNFMNRITIDARSPSAFSTVNPGMFKAAEYLLFYAKNRSLLKERSLRVERTPDYAYNQFIVNFEEPFTDWKYVPVAEAYQERKTSSNLKPQSILSDFHKFIIHNAHRIFRFTAISDSGAGKAIVGLKYESKKAPCQIFKFERKDHDDIYIMNGQQLSFYSKNIAVIDGSKKASRILTDIWTDIAWEGIANEGGVQFKKGKKPERLIKRCLELVTEPGDIVLDSFLGSGTTAAVAHKIGRRWIGIELGEQCYSHCIPRLRRVIDGTDQSGISSIVDWHGGGGFRFYKLAPSLVVETPWGLPTVNPEYNGEMLAEALCKLNGYTFTPSREIFWQQGQGTENCYLYATTQTMTTSMLEYLSDEVGEGRFLIVYCGAYEGSIERFPNLMVKKIPKEILERCEWNHDDYSLQVESLPQAESLMPDSASKKKRGSKTVRRNLDQGALFDFN